MSYDTGWYNGLDTEGGTTIPYDFNLRRTKHRQQLAAIVGASIALGIPAIVGAVMLLASAWLAGMNVLGIKVVPNVHHTLWGWLSDIEHRPAVKADPDVGRFAEPAQTLYQANSVPLAWVMG